MTSISRRHLFSLAMLASPALAAAVVACSLGLPSQDTYFGGADAAGSRDEASAEASVNANIFPESDASPGDAAPADSGGFSAADAAAGADATGYRDAPGDSVTTSTDEAGDGGAAVPTFDAAAVLQLYYSFDPDVVAADGAAGDGGEADSGGSDAGPPTVVSDRSGHAFDGILKGSTLPTIDPAGRIGQGLKLDGRQMQYVVLPAKAIAGLDSMSVSCWINLTTPSVWSRLFDFNAGPTVWVYYSPTGWNDTTHQPGTRFAISAGRSLDPEMQLTTTVPTGAWHHVAIVLSRPYFLYYEDGVEKYRTASMTLAPKDLLPTQNWIGRSSFLGDPYLSATIDDFRIYSGGLTPQEIAQLAGP